MSARQLAIDWSDLEFALTWRTAEGGHYLDLTTGQIIAWTGQEDDQLSEDDIDAGLAEGRLIAIEPLESSVEYGWMQDFASSVADSYLGRLLEVALNGAGAFRRFKGVLEDYPTERERWFVFRDERVREASREWLEENGVEGIVDGNRTR